MVSHHHGRYRGVEGGRGEQAGGGAGADFHQSPASAWERPTVVGAVPLGLGLPLLLHDSRGRSGLVGGDVVFIVRCGHKGDSVFP